MIEKQFCEELQELLDRYKTHLPVPTIMRNAQKIFHNTLSFRVHPELHPYATERDYLARFITDGGQLSAKVWIDEALEMEKK